MRQRLQATIGRLVLSKAGHDEGKLFVIVRVEPPYAWIADGRHRPLERPKKKKLKHLHLTPILIKDVQSTLEGGGVLGNGELRNMIKRTGRLDEEEDQICLKVT